tara:strand:- start:724 stop:864 length:141 start_codon:yes stop_codon:yes gene_type:complete
MLNVEVLIINYWNNTDTNDIIYDNNIKNNLKNNLKNTYNIFIKNGT